MISGLVLNAGAGCTERLIGYGVDAANLLKPCSRQERMSLFRDCIWSFFKMSLHKPEPIDASKATT